MPSCAGVVGARQALKAGALMVLASCAGDRPVPAIGLAAGSEGVPEVAAAMLKGRGIDSTRVRLVRGQGSGGLAGEVEQAAFLSRLPGIAAVVGHAGSRGSLLGAPIYGELGIPLIVPLGTSRRLDDAGPHVFRMVPDDSIEGAFIAAFALDSLRARALTIAYTPDEYGLGLRAGIQAALAARGSAAADVVAIGDVDCVNVEDYALMVRASLNRGRPDVVVVAAPSHAAGCMTRAFSDAVPGVGIIMGDGAEPSTIFSARAGASGEGAYFVAFWHPSLADSAGRHYLDTFARIVGRSPTPAEVVWHDAITLAAEAVVQAGPRPERVRRWLAELGGTRPAWVGVTGPVTFTERRLLRLVMLRYAGGTTTVVRAP